MSRVVITLENTFDVDLTDLGVPENIDDAEKLADYLGNIPLSDLLISWRFADGMEIWVDGYPVRNVLTKP
jgi:hypothetical protein